jgi:GNAT superfamily N-acetyltransferase
MTFSIRHAVPSDHYQVVVNLDAWWGGRQMSDMLPRLFFTHFQPTTFVAEQDGQLAGFLAGFISQTDPATGYVHFIGVDPSRRGLGIGEALYGRFFDAARPAGCQRVHAVTSRINHGSIAFHRRIGFSVLPGDGNADGTAYTIGYDGPDRDCVRFEFDLRALQTGAECN